MSEIHSIDIAPSLPKMEKLKQRVGIRMRIWEFLREMKRRLGENMESWRSSKKRSRRLTGICT